MKNKTENYMPPLVQVFNVEMEEGIASASNGSTAPGSSPTIDDYGEGEGSSGWIIDDNII